MIVPSWASARLNVSPASGFASFTYSKYGFPWAATVPLSPVVTEWRSSFQISHCHPAPMKRTHSRTDSGWSVRNTSDAGLFS